AIQNSDVGGSVRELSEPVELFSIAWLVGTAGRIELPFEISRVRQQTLHVLLEVNPFVVAFFRGKVRHRIMVWTDSYKRVATSGPCLNGNLPNVRASAVHSIDSDTSYNVAENQSLCTPRIDNAATWARRKTLVT